MQFHAIFFIFFSFAIAPKAPVASNVSPAGTTGQAWMQKGQLHAQKQFVFEKPSEVINHLIKRLLPESQVLWNFKQWTEKLQTLTLMVLCFKTNEKAELNC